MSRKIRFRLKSIPRNSAGSCSRSCSPSPLPPKTVLSRRRASADSAGRLQRTYLQLQIRACSGSSTRGSSCAEDGAVPGPIRQPMTLLMDPEVLNGSGPRQAGARGVIFDPSVLALHIISVVANATIERFATHRDRRTYWSPSSKKYVRENYVPKCWGILCGTASKEFERSLRRSWRDVSRGCVGPAHPKTLWNRRCKAARHDH